MLKGIFSESGETSSMRVMSFLLVLAGIAVSIIGMVMDYPLSEVALLVGTLIGFAMTGKVTQSISENKYGGSDEIKK